MDGSIAYINLKGGGPTKQHTRTQSPVHRCKGEAKVLLDEKETIIHQDDAFLVKGIIPHSVWSNQNDETVMIGISVR